MTTTQPDAQPPEGLSLSRLAAAKQIPIDFLQALGCSDGRWHGCPAVRIGYRDEHDREVTHQYRIALAGDRFRFPSGAQLIPYGIWRRATTNTPAWIFLVEGPSDCWTLWSHDIPAIGLPSASIWREEWTRYFEGIALIYVIDEGGQGGQTLLTALAGSALHDRVRVSYTWTVRRTLPSFTSPIQSASSSGWLPPVKRRNRSRRRSLLRRRPPSRTSTRH